MKKKSMVELRIQNLAAKIRMFLNFVWDFAWPKMKLVPGVYEEEE